MPYDLFIGIPVHSAPDPLATSGLAVNGWVPVDQTNLRTRFPNVYALGDVSSGPRTVPKAGIFAESAALVVADEIAAEIAGVDRLAVQGWGICSAEFGDGLVSKVEVNFLGGPTPVAARDGLRSHTRPKGGVRSDPPRALVRSLISLDFYDVELRAHHEHVRAAWGIDSGDAVLDVGCGTGLTTREAGRAAAPGGVLGVDVSERMLERARLLTADEPIGNVRYELGDAQVHRFDHAGVDVAISRFGTMFFADPAAAFANLAAALRPQARLVLLVWQPHERNEWALAIDAALGTAAQPWPAGSTPSRWPMPMPLRASSSAPASPESTSRMSTSRSSTDTTSMLRSRSSAGFRTRARPSRA